MFDQILTITESVISSFVHIWPYLLVTIPISVAVQMSGAARYINRALGTRPLVAILLATAVGAFSPFCSCGVIPVIAALLIGGVPLAPVMSFWIASPSMDPEIFFLSVSSLGWNLAIWRLVSTLVMSLVAGFITHFAVQNGWLGEKILRSHKIPAIRNRRVLVKQGLHFVTDKLNIFKENLAAIFFQRKAAAVKIGPDSQMACCTEADTAADRKVQFSAAVQDRSLDSTSEDKSECGCDTTAHSFLKRLLGETWKATAMVAKFMALSFFLTALIQLYVPSEWIAGLLGKHNIFSIFTATLIGIPMYTSNLAALPLISGLLSMGMNPGAALAFLVAGPTTTLPAMAAVWGITSRRVFALYLSIALIGALIFGNVYMIITAF
jgi:uncharacterized membrane protein YraQ (UPF0718 family)